MHQLLKFGWNHSRGYGVVGVLISGGLVVPKFSVPPSGETASDPKMFWRCKNVLEVLYHLAKFGWPWISHAATASKNFEFFVCLSVYPSPLWMTGLWMTEFVCMILPWRHWSTETVLTPLDRETFCSCVQLPLYTVNWRMQKSKE